VEKKKRNTEYKIVCPRPQKKSKQYKRNRQTNKKSNKQFFVKV
jgi:hypothetical protein